MAIPTQDNFAVPGVGIAQFNVLNISPSQKRQAYYSNRHVAHGNKNVLQAGGRGPAERHYRIYIPSEDELVALDQLCGLIGGTLTYEKGSVGAFLASYDATGWWNGTEQLVDCVFVTDSD